MRRVLFTIDYEIHGNGDGCPKKLMVQPTEELLRLLNDYGAKLTIMADVAEIMRFKEYKESTGRDDYYYDAIVAQLRHAISTGHDVQLHIHSSYFNAIRDKDHWEQDWSEYNFAGLPYDRMEWMIETCKRYLETLLRPVDPTYSCVAFRAANWSVSPSRNVVRALIKNNIHIDTSVFKYGRRDGLVTFDYSDAHSSFSPWRVNEDDICSRDDNGQLWELPIYSEKRWIGAFLTAGRLSRVIGNLRHQTRLDANRGHGGDGDERHARRRMTSLVKACLNQHAWKADINQCGGRQLIGALHRASGGHVSGIDVSLPFVLIGHSKLFTSMNARRLKPFLSHVSRHPEQFGFDTIRGVDLTKADWEAL
jgi:hypothetical protein